VESLFPEEDRETKREAKDPLKIMASGQGDKADTSVNVLGLGLGYGMVFGRSDIKAIAMSILDYSLNAADSGSGENHGSAAPGGGTSILENQEFVLLHGDCLEMNGFISHLKLPHYVTFQSKLDRVRHTREKTGGPHDGL
jgi:alpha-D-ribose 1-methylphosphonate 5-triphosphate synthase subunit PhnI